ncbi:unnamed protein product [Phytophthora lilii]|uniref:Unnamed protein product n=1 Tax=Phytophthora lilii TaxID=2077276 RepID=A0A9W6TLL8_9STRA|nr:unnamed protein product [Phytophthora lilii]
MCFRKLSVGGLGGPPSMEKLYVVTTYDASSCSTPVASLSLTRNLSCTPQIDHYKPVCYREASAYTVADCTQYHTGGRDNIGIIRDDYPHLIVENFGPGLCGLVDGNVKNVVVYS